MIDPVIEKLAHRRRMWPDEIGTPYYAFKHRTPKRVEVLHWIYEHTSGEFICTLEHVVFKEEKDALMFKLSYHCD